MKEIEKPLTLPSEHKVELSVKKKQEIEYVLQGTIKPKRGHFIWELNEESGEIKKAQYKRNIAVFGAKPSPEELIINSDCVYIPALNSDNAKKKYLKNKEQAHYFSVPSPMNLSDITF